MKSGRRYLSTDVLTAARERVKEVFDGFERLYVAFSGGKDSTVLLDLVAQEARARRRRFGLLFIDLEAQYRLTIDFIAEAFERYADRIDPYWLALPISLRNAVSMHEPQWVAWDPRVKDRWVREPHPLSIMDVDQFAWYRFGMEFEDLVDEFARWYAGGIDTCCLVAIRSDESINRFRVITQDNPRWDGHHWTTQKSQHVVNAYPIFDWRTEDIWRYHAKTSAPYNPLYDRMHAAGLKISQMRICQPYGDDQRKGLWLYHIIEPQTWPRVVARVGGANSGALYAREHGNINGVGRVSLPAGHTWESYALLLLDSLPPHASEHFRTKISVFIRWWQDHGYPKGIPDVSDPRSESKRTAPSWRRITKAILRNDWWCKGLGFAQHKSGAYSAYMCRMKERRQEWAIL